jgi:hypothetical protein
VRYAFKPFLGNKFPGYPANAVSLVLYAQEGILKVIDEFLLT